MRRESLRSGWSVRQLDRQIGSQFYERIALSRNKAAMLQKAEIAEPGDTITPEEAIKDPFVLEFLGFKDEYSETQLEEGLIQHLTDFLLELGDDFAFLARQKRLRIDDTWFRIDLLLFHRRLRCLVVIDLLCGRPHNSSSVAQPVMWRSANQAAIFTPFQYLNAT
jgi:predicted nuclease of restriction endonuclease-like (RecB) superfamily